MNFFTDPILQAPTIGCILMCSAASLMGAVLFFQRRLMLSESISHAAYPGAVLGVLLLSMFGPEYEEYSFLAVLLGALVSSWLGLKAIGILERKMKLKTDPALCFTLAIFFGIGVLFTSYLQESAPVWLSQTQGLLYGQAATLTDIHIAIYGGLAIFCTVFIAVAFLPLQAILFDRAFAKSIGIPIRAVERLLFWLLLFSIVAGIRSVGVILMSGMLIAPSVAARQFSNSLKTIFVLSALFGATSGLLGNILSVKLSIPTGPSIVLVGTAFAFIALLFSPKRGMVFRLCRLAAFRLRCLEENILKGMWKKGCIDKQELMRRYPRSGFALYQLNRYGWIAHSGNSMILTEDGKIKAASIVRLHRLWELYLTEELGLQAERVHRSAEEMEHILTPELEERLTRLLSNPARDPHHQPIPERRPL